MGQGGDGTDRHGVVIEESDADTGGDRHSLTTPSPHPRRWWVLTAVGIGTFMSALDGSIVNTVLPLLREELHTTVAGIEWVTTVYLLVVSGLLLGFGRAGDLYGQKRVYLLGFVAFMIGSILCGLAPTAHALSPSASLPSLSPGRRGAPRSPRSPPPSRWSDSASGSSSHPTTARSWAPPPARGRGSPPASSQPPAMWGW